MNRIETNGDNHGIENHPDIAPFLEDVLSSGSWFQFPKKFLYILDVDTSLLLAFLINLSRYVKAYKRNEGWFYCHWRMIEKDLRFSQSKQTRLFNTLKTRGFIETKLEGIPARRFIKVQFASLIGEIFAISRPIEDEEEKENALRSDRLKKIEQILEEKPGLTDEEFDDIVMGRFDPTSDHGI